MNPEVKIDGWGCLIAKHKFKFVYFFLLFVLILFGTQQIPSSDDYCFINGFRDFGAVNYAHKAYFNWSGRFILHVVTATLFSFTGIEYIFLVSAFNYILFFLTVFLISQIVAKSKAALVDKSFLFISWSFILLSVSFGMREALSQIVSWPTGGLFYTFPIFLFFLTLKTIIFNDKGNLLEVMLVILSSFLLEPLNPALFTAIVCKYFFPFDKDAKSSYSWIIVFTILSCSAAFYLAPGNFARANRGSMAATDLSALFKLLANYFYLLYKTLRYLWLSTLLAAVGGVIVGATKKSDFKVFREIPGDILFLLLALASLSPFVLATDFYNMRASSFTVILITISTFIHFARNSNRYLKSGIKFAPVKVAFFISCITAGSFLFDTIRAHNVKNLVYERHNYLQRSQGQDIVVPSLKEKAKAIKVVHLDDVSSDKDHWINKCVGEYYSLKSIKAEK